MKFSIIMPTYNDADTITEALDSLRLQTYENWELIIVDDGSQDDTKSVIEAYIREFHLEAKMFYYYEENQDQLNALLYGSRFIHGEYVYIFHSDDLLYDENVIASWKNLVEQDPHAQGFFGNYQIIDGEGNAQNVVQVKPYQRKDAIFAEQLLWLGRNLYADFALHTREAFLHNVTVNYLKWNTPFWLNLQDTPYLSDYRSVDQCFFRYRVFEQNYIHNEIGKLNVINGELRTALWLMHDFSLPMYRLQYVLYRVCHRLHWHYPVVYHRCETKNKAQIISFIIKKRYPNGQNYPNLCALISFYEHRNSRMLDLTRTEFTFPLFYGKDMRAFHKQMLADELPPFYKDWMREMKTGFDAVMVLPENRDAICVVLKFFGIDKDVKVMEKR